MYKKILISVTLLLLLVIIFNFLQPILTGLVTDIAEIFLSVGNTTNAAFVYFSYTSSLTLGDTASFTVELQNIGSMSITSAITIYVKDSSLTTVSTSSDSNYTLAPLDIRNYSTTYTPTSTGTYYVYANATYNSTDETGSVEENRTFTVSPSAVIPSPPFYPGIYIPPIIPTYNLSLEYPELVNLTINESYLILIYATNYGNVDLHNFSFLVSVEKIEWEVIPSNLSVLTPDTTAMFYISVEVPSDAEIKNYTLDFTVKTLETSKKGRITVNVSLIPEEYCPLGRRMIQNYIELIDRTGKEIERAASQGRNVTAALTYYREAIKEFALAKDYFNAGECEDSKVYLERVRYFLILAIIELAKSIIPSSPWLFYAIVIILTSIAIATILIVAKRRKLKMIAKPVISILSEELERKKKLIKDIEKLHRKKRIKKGEYGIRKRVLEKDVEKIEIEIIVRFGTERQLTLLENMRKAYKEEIISRKMYIKSREKLADNVIKEEERALGKEKKKF